MLNTAANYISTPVKVYTLNAQSDTIIMAHPNSIQQQKAISFSIMCANTQRYVVTRIIPQHSTFNKFSDIVCECIETIFNIFIESYHKQYSHHQKIQKIREIVNSFMQEHKDAFFNDTQI